MENNGSMINIDRFSQEIVDFSNSKWELDQIKNQKQALEKLTVLAQTILQSAQEGDAATVLQKLLHADEARPKAPSQRGERGSR